MAYQTRNHHIQAVIYNHKFIITDYVAAKKSGFLDWRRDLCDWSISSPTIQKAMPSRHLTECTEPD